MVDFLPVEVCDDENEEPAVAETPSPDILISIELRHGRTVRLPSTLPCHEIRRLIAAVDSARSAWAPRFEFRLPAALQI